MRNVPFSFSVGGPLGTDTIVHLTCGLTAGVATDSGVSA